MTNSQNKFHLYSAREAYDIASNDYEKWPWYRFWRTNEAPMIDDWLGGRTGIALDAGCGNAPYISELCKSKGPKFLLDISGKMLEHARSRTPKRNKKNIYFVQSDLRATPFPSAFFDFAICTRVLSNISDVGQVIRELGRVLKTGGDLIITDIHPHHCYDYTAIETSTGKIFVETFKHEISTLIEHATTSGFSLLSQNEYSLINLRKEPDKIRFSKIYLNPSAPIFFSLELRKNK